MILHWISAVVELDWCPCIDDQTRIDFAQATVRDIQKQYSTSEPLTIISLGSGALKQEELIARLLLDAGYTTLTLVLIDILYTQQKLPSLKELEVQTAVFEVMPEFEKIGDLYIELEYTDDHEVIKNIEQEIAVLEKKIEIQQYITLCDQQAAFLHPERLALLTSSLALHAPQATIHIQAFASVDDYLKKNPTLQNCCILFVDADTRNEYKEKQVADLQKLSRLPAKMYHQVFIL